LHATDNSGGNALHLASSRRYNTDILPILVNEYGFVTDTFDYHGLTPMHYAMSIFNTFRTLQSLGGNVDTPDSNGRTPLHLTGLLPTLDILNRGGLTSVKEASLIAKIMMDFGANREARDRSGKTPAELARENGQIEVANFIEKYKHRDNGRRTQ
jgi:ankyrin repeat protein